MWFYVTCTITLLCITVGVYFVYRSRLEISPLRCVGRTMDVFVRNAPALVLLGAFAFLPAWLMGNSVPEATDPDPIFAPGLVESFFTMVLYLGGVFMLPGILAPVSLAARREARPEFWSSISRGLSGIGRSFLLAPLLTLYAICVPLIVAFVLSGIGALLEFDQGLYGVSTGVGLAISLGLLSPCSVSFPVAVNERATPARSLNRSGDLMQRHRGTSLVLLLGWATLLIAGRAGLALLEERGFVLGTQAALVAITAAYYPLALMSGVFYAEVVETDDVPDLSHVRHAFD